MNPLIQRMICENLEAQEQGNNNSVKGNANAVIVKTRPVEYYVCPHCNEEILEKSTFSDDEGDTLKHNVCGGIVEYPEPDTSNCYPWVQELVAAAKAKKNSAPAPKAFLTGDSTATTL